MNNQFQNYLLSFSGEDTSQPRTLSPAPHTFTDYPELVAQVKADVLAHIEAEKKRQEYLKSPEFVAQVKADVARYLADAKEDGTPDQVSGLRNALDIQEDNEPPSGADWHDNPDSPMGYGKRQ